MSKLGNILNGWQNFIAKSEVTELEAVERAKHCIDCKHKAFSKTLKAFVQDDLVQIEGYVCMKCESSIKCPLSAKLRSENETCPLSKW